MLKKILIYILAFSVIAIIVIQLANPFELEATSNNVFEEDTVTQVVKIKRKVLEKNPYVEQVASDYDTYVQETMDKLHIPGAAIVIIKDSSIVSMKGYGLRQIGTSDSVDVHSVFRIASLSKGFGAMLTGILVEKGVLCWDDSVTHYLPDFQMHTEEATKNMTIRNLLSHTTGLPRHAYTDCLEDGSEFDKIVFELRDVPLIGKVGQFYSYQNVAYSIIASIIEKATGKSFEQVLQEELFSPLMIDDGSYSFMDMVQTENRANPHVKVARKRWAKTRIQDKYYNAIPAGGINASIADMSQYLLALMGNRPGVISQETLDDMFTPQVRTYVRYKYFAKWKYARKPYYGLGWRLLRNKQDEIVYHGGYINGYKAEIAYNRTTKTGICALFNSANQLSYQCIPDFFEMYDLYRDSIDKFENSRNRQLAISTSK